VPSKDDAWRWQAPGHVLTVEPASLRGRIENPDGGNRWSFDGVDSLTRSGAAVHVEACEQLPNGCRAVIRIGDITAGVEIALTTEPATAPAGVTLSVTPVRDAELTTSLRWPPPLRPDGSPVVELALPIKNTNGVVYHPSPGEQVGLTIEVAGGNSAGLSMPFWSSSTTTGGLLCVLDDPDDAELTIASSDRTGVDVGVGWRPSLGTLRSPRRVTLRLLDEPGYVAAATTYREVVRSAGRFTSLADKIEERPVVGQLVGAPYFSTGYLPFSRRKLTQVLAGLQDIGYRAGLLGPVDLLQWDAEPWLNDYQPFIHAPDFADPITAAGFTPFAWFYLEDILDFDPTYDPAMLAVDRDGTVPQGWVNRDYRYRRVCDSVLAEHGRRLRKRAEQFAALHFDTTTSKALMECWADDHPMTRKDDRLARRSWLAEVAGWGHVIGSESGYDWAFDVMDFCSNNPRRDLRTNFPAPARHVPLQGLVYHDAVVSYCWEYDPYNKSYWGGDWSRQKILYDAMCGNPPTVSPVFGYFPVISADEGAVGSSWVTWEDPETQRLLRQALPVARLHERVALQPMLAHSCLDDAGTVTRTVFADGTEVLVNAGTERFDDGHQCLDASSYAVDGHVEHVGGR
jgi:Glycosyl hydrolases related to GH101 family, GH129